MLQWLKSFQRREQGLPEILRLFGQMLDDGRHAFDAAANCLLGGTDPEVIREDLWGTDKRINRTQQQIRRMVVTHGTVCQEDFATCLLIMSLVKDAERIGDYSKNIFDVANLGISVPKSLLSDMVRLKDTTSLMLVKCKNIFETQDKDAARDFCSEAGGLMNHCENQVTAFLIEEEGGGSLVASALAYRYFKRILGHAQNILTSLLVPLDQVDFFEDQNPPGEVAPNGS
ncbi:MAG: hypothetical protein DWQ01_06180 [Planctomycetota bacterium]|nr:MAG: hypothetical protein DWQ01_06180 [Planctomycetota bacterium]